MAPAEQASCICKARGTLRALMPCKSRTLCCQQRRLQTAGCCISGYLSGDSAQVLPAMVGLVSILKCKGPWLERAYSEGLAAFKSIESQSCMEQKDEWQMGMLED